jgi:hypothetical protein
VGTNGCPQEALAARQRQSRQAMPTAPGMPGAAPSDPGHGGEGAGDGCAGIIPLPVAGRGEPGDRQVPGQVSHPARTRSRASTGTRCAHRRRMQDGARLGQRGIWLLSVRGRRLMPVAQPAKSAGTPPGDDDLVRPPRTRGGGRQPALPAGQQPARGALATGTGPLRVSGFAGPVSGKDCHRPCSTTGTDPDVAGPLGRRCPGLFTVSRLTGPERQVVPSRHRRRSRPPFPCR